MYVSCNDYLRRVGRRPNDYVAALMTLRSELTDEIEELSRLDNRLVLRAPGAAEAQVANERPGSASRS
jgi:hypothetical protein